MKDYKELDVWKKSMDLVSNVYELIEKFPAKEKYVLTDQIRRAAVSIPCNIAEGFSRNTTKDYIRFLYISSGSAAELETLILIATNLEYMKGNEKLIDKIISIKKMLSALITSLKFKNQK